MATQKFYAGFNAAQYAGVGRLRLAQDVRPSATLQESSGRALPLYSEKDLDAYKAELDAQAVSS